MNIINFLNDVATNVPWATIGEVVAASGLLSFILVPLKKPVANWFKHNEQMMITLVGVGGVLIAAANYLLTTPTQNPSIIAMQGFVVAFGSQPFYFIIVKPLLRWITKQIAKGIALSNDVQSALLPVAEIKEETTPVVEVAPVVPVADTDVHSFDS